MSPGRRTSLRVIGRTSKGRNIAACCIMIAAAAYGCAILCRKSGNAHVIAELMAVADCGALVFFQFFNVALAMGRLTYICEKSILTIQRRLYILARFPAFGFAIN